MIIIEAGQRDAKSFEAKVMFAAQLVQRGYSPVIDDSTFPDKTGRFLKYEAAPLLANISDISASGLIVLGAEDLCESTLSTIRSYSLPPETMINAMGRFAEDQAYIAATSKLSFALGREVNVVDLNELQPRPILEKSISPLAAMPHHKTGGRHGTPELFLFLPIDLLEEPETLPVLGAMDHLAGFQLNIITGGKGKELVRKTKFSDLPVFGLAELPPTALATLADIAVFFGDGVPGERMANFSLDLLKHSGVLVDCTASGAFVSCGAPAIRGPQNLASLANYLEHTVIPNRHEIGRQTQTDKWLMTNSIERLEEALHLPAPPTEPSPKKRTNPKTVFLPTNGNGLGHAQRCSLIASEMPRPPDCTFAAFPSCIPLINSKGFACTPLVQKSEYHTEEYANDLVNYLRLQRTVQTGDRLVFDGGYVFDSIYRTIMEKSLSATWVRRGLWQPGQVRASSLEREKAFDTVIVPNEAFDELNAAYTFGRKVHQVGPIVQQSAQGENDRLELRQKLTFQLGHEFDELVITMLGGGVATDRSAQLQTLCALLERRPKCLHLIIVWPGSKVSNGLYGWKNTRVIKSKNALALCQASDLLVSAVGYNSFHEILYHGLASILIPQTAPFMDDQEKRARAASDRGLASTVLDNEFMLLEREITNFLDNGKAGEIRKALANTDLPKAGTRDAAALIHGGVEK